jgi:hypothetical protein
LVVHCGFWMRAEKRWSDNTVSSLNGPVCECTQILMLVMNLNCRSIKFKCQSLNPHGDLTQQNT